MIKKIFFVSLLFLMLFSCEKSTFNVISSNLYLEKIDGSDTLIFSSSIDGVEGEEYSIIITDPNNVISWSDQLTEEDGFYRAFLELTNRAVFPEGEYSYRIYGSRGTEAEGAVSYYAP